MWNWKTRYPQKIMIFPKLEMKKMNCAESEENNVYFIFV